MGPRKYRSTSSRAPFPVENLSRALIRLSPVIYRIMNGPHLAIEDQPYIYVRLCTAYATSASYGPRVTAMHGTSSIIFGACQCLSKVTSGFFTHTMYGPWMVTIHGTPTALQGTYRSLVTTISDFPSITHVTITYQTHVTALCGRRLRPIPTLPCSTMHWFW